MFGLISLFYLLLDLLMFIINAIIYKIGLFILIIGLLQWVIAFITKNVWNRNPLNHVFFGIVISATSKFAKVIETDSFFNKKEYEGFGVPIIVLIIYIVYLIRSKDSKE